MSQRVPSWDLDEAPNITAHQPPPLHHHHVPSADHGPAMSDYEVAELTWENGNVAMHGFGHPRICKPIAKYPSSGPMAAAMAAAAAVWEKPRQGGTLESIVDQATGAQFFPHSAVSHPHFLSWFGGPHQHMEASSAGTAAGVDALVPCSSSFHPAQHSDNVPTLGRGMGCSGGGRGRKRARAGDGGWNCTSQGSAAAPTVVTLDDTCELYGADDVEFTTTSSPDGEAEDGGRSPDTENTSFGGHDSVGHSRPSQRDGVGDEDGEKTNKRDLERSSISTKRSRAAAIHNQSERKRRDRINEKMKTLQKLVPNSSKTDKASMLDEVIDYLKQLQAQVQMISRMNSITHMMMPMAMPQLQMSMMANMSHMAHMAQMAQMAQMGMMDMSSLGRPGPTGMPPLLHPPAAFMPLAGGSWDASCNRMPHAGGAVLPDPFSAFFPCPSQQQQQQQQQQMNMDAYNKMAALYQQLYQQPHQSNLKN